MSDELIKLGDVYERYTSTGRVQSYAITCRHLGLREERDLVSADVDILKRKVGTLVTKWAEKWDKRLEHDYRQNNVSTALAHTEEAQDALQSCANILSDTCAVNDSVQWAMLRKEPAFVWEHGNKPNVRYSPDKGAPLSAVYRPPPPKVDPSAEKYHPRIGLRDLITGRKKKKIADAEKQLANDIAVYEKLVADNEVINAKARETFQQELEAYNSAKQECIDQINLFNTSLEQLEADWRNGGADAVLEHVELVLDNSSYPDWYEYNYELEYESETKKLIAEYQLPAPDRFPTLEKVTYRKTTDELIEKHITDAKKQKMIDSVYYQVALRTIHEIYEADEPHNIHSIVFNGWVRAVNRATGRSENSCILSVQALKEEFICFDLARVDPKACFKALKGVSASVLSNLTPIRPIININRNDTRFVDSYAVTHTLDDSVNLAAMDWQDFEHLIRELFEKEFSNDGSEVKVTQASRDGGVDAVVFDPHPIKGGKIVIQAKRYTGTVTVSAVRDLYGTVLNEGANRGILVTTSDYGPDAYKFAADKPITLLNGANLLSLLADHGHKAKIDRAEAKRMFSQR